MKTFDWINTPLISGQERFVKSINYNALLLCFIFFLLSQCMVNAQDKGEQSHKQEHYYILTGLIKE